MTQQLMQGIPGVATQAVAAAPAIGGVATQAIGAVEQPAPAAAEVQQVALPAGFDLMTVAVHKAKAESSNARKSPWECTAEELRERVTFRDVQAPSNRDATQAHLRPFLSPKSLPLEDVLGPDANGNPRNTLIVPAQYAEATKEAFLAQVVNAGLMDNLLLATAQQMHKDKLEKDAQPKKAPVDTAAADAALDDLTAAQGVDTGLAVPTGAAPVAVPAGVPAGIPTQATGVPAGIPNAAPTGLPTGGLPTGVPAGIPSFG